MLPAERRRSYQFWEFDGLKKSSQKPINTSLSNSIVLQNFIQGCDTLKNIRIGEDFCRDGIGGGQRSKGGANMTFSDTFSAPKAPKNRNFWKFFGKNWVK